jgi:hypothetical protein
MISIRARHSRRALAIQRSAIALARGAWTGVFVQGYGEAALAAARGGRSAPEPTTRTAASRSPSTAGPPDRACDENPLVGLVVG